MQTKMHAQSILIVFISLLITHKTINNKTTLTFQILGGDEEGGDGFIPVIIVRRVGGGGGDGEGDGGFGLPSGFPFGGPGGKSFPPIKLNEQC